MRGAGMVVEGVGGLVEEEGGRRAWFAVLLCEETHETSDVKQGEWGRKVSRVMLEARSDR